MRDFWGFGVVDFDRVCEFLSVGGPGPRPPRDWARARGGASSAKERRREIEREGVLEER
jgi:hypothetical protein